MTKSLVEHRLLYRLKCSELKGMEFQSFFERVMARVDSTFTPVKPMGASGDWKCDGYSAATKTVYQCYAPDVLTATKTCDKVLADFAGAKSHWGNQMKSWLFVWNAQALPPQVVSLLETLQREHPDVEIDQVGRDKLWDAIVSKLDHQVLNEILGEASSPSEAVEAHLRAARRGLHGKDDSRIRDMCLDVLALTEGDEALRLNRVEAHEILAILALKEPNTREARHQLQEMGTLLGDDIKAAVCANYHRHLGLLSMLEEKVETAEAEFRAVLAVQPRAPHDTADEEKLHALQCMAKADLVLHWCRHDEAARAEVVGKEILAFVQVNPEALDGQLICHAVDALVTLAAYAGDRQSADDALRLLDEHCRSKEQAYEASKVLQKLAGRTTHFFDQPEISVACSELAVPMALRADRDDFYWVALFNMAVSFLHLGETEEANERLNLLLPLLESSKVDNAIKVGVLALASELASKRGDAVKAVEYQQQMVSYAADDPMNMIGTLHGVGRKLQEAGRVSEAFDAFAKTARLARDQLIPGEAHFDILARLAESAIMIGRWHEAEEAIAKLTTLPRPSQFVEDTVATLQKQFEGTRELRSRIEAIKAVVPVNAPMTLLEANAAALKPLLAWWREIEPTGIWFGDRKKAGALDDDDSGLRVLYDYWGGGGAARVMANLRQFAPGHFSPFIQVRSVEEIRRAIRMFALISDVLVLLWKGEIHSQLTFPLVPITDIIGGAGYTGFFGTVLLSKSGTRWVGALGIGAYLPESVCRFLSTEAAGLLEQGRLIVLPAPAVGCWQPEHGPCEELLVDLTGATPIMNRSAQLGRVHTTDNLC